MATFRVDLEAYNGPLDLLLFLIRREEVDVYDIPIARITEQYVLYVKLLEALDPNLAGDFLVMAATLMEIKSRTLLPTPPAEEEEEEFIDPRMELVR
ncbi:MAG: segregation and condensation protein A, partial [Planctomycetota bacterium]